MIVVEPDIGIKDGPKTATAKNNNKKKVWFFFVITLMCVIFTQCTLINILITGSPEVSRGAGAKMVSIDRVGVTVGAFLTGVTDAGIFQLTQQTWRENMEELTTHNDLD